MNQDLTWLEPLSPKEIIEDELVKKHKKDRFYVLYSGGKDSSSVADFIVKNYPEYYAGHVFTNTGIATPITRKFVLQYSKKMGWDVEMTWPKKSYYDIVINGGFPRPQYHRVVMGYLKYHSWHDYLIRKINSGEKACFISGVRKKESVMRDKVKFYTKKPIDVDGKLTFAKPFLYKNGSQLSEYFIINGLKATPASDWFDKSGECWCGCFWNKWDLKMLETHDPFIFQTIKWLEKQIQIRGTDEAKKRPYWGSFSGVDSSESQTTFDDFTVNEDYCGESCEVE